MTLASNTQKYASTVHTSSFGVAKACTVLNTFLTIISANNTNRDKPIILPALARAGSCAEAPFLRESNATTRMSSTIPFNASCSNRLAFRSARAEWTTDGFALVLKYVAHPWAVQETMALVKAQTTRKEMVVLRCGIKSIVSGEERRRV
jgi:hypothetical protein